MGKILVIDDDPGYLRLFLRQLAVLGHESASASGIREGLAVAETFCPDVIFLDVNLPDGSGLSAIGSLKGLPGQPEIIIITGNSNPDGAELAVRSGAWSYIPKQGKISDIVLPLINVLEYRQQKKAAVPRALDLGEMVGKSLVMKECFDSLAQAAGSDANVLISGESGTGKELCAWAIHHNSRRKPYSFVVVDCAALPENLVESMLFGHRKGAFTGASENRVGLLEQADGGTLFLDEVAELPLMVQKAFLRAIQERRFRPVGADREVKSDFRLVAATNRDLERMVREGLFREDLFFRLRALFLHLPPLRERGNDIREIAQVTVTRICERAALDTKGISAEFFAALSVYPWPGNVRELIHAMEHAVAVAGGQQTLYSNCLPTEIRVHAARSIVDAGQSPSAAGGTCGSTALAGLQSFQQFREQTSKTYLKNLMQATGGNIEEACRLSGLSRAHLYTLLKEHAISRK